MPIYKNRRSITTVNKHLPFVWRVNYLHEASTPEIMPEIAHEKARQICVFDWMEPTYLELQLYSMRHIQEHAAQLNLVLGEHDITGQDWVAKARETVS